MMDTLNKLSPLQLRVELGRLVRQDLLGPAGDEREELEEANVRGRYIVGLLAPKGQSLLPDDEDPLAADEGKMARRIRPCRKWPRCCRLRLA